MRTHPLRWFGPLAIVALVLAACGDESADPTPGEDPGDARPVIVATTSILGDVISGIVGDDAVVEVIMPIGADPHDFEPSAQQAALLRDAAVVVANGYGLEVGLVSALDAAASDGATVIELGSLIDPLASGASSHDHEDDDPDQGGEDPHFWHDPHRMADAVPGLAELIVEALPELDAGALRDRARALAEEYEAVDDEVAEILAAVPDERRYLITNHDTLGYFAMRYGFEVIGTVIPGGDTLAAPSAADLAELVEEIREHDLPAVFADNTVAPGLARALAEEAGLDVEVVALYTDSLGEPGSEADTYVGMLLANARLVATALA